MKNLRLKDIAGRTPGPLTLLSVRLPARLIDRVDALVDQLGCGKTEAVVALLNEGLERVGTIGVECSVADGGPAGIEQGPAVDERVGE